jgi:type IV secretion system protein VirD4
MRGWSWARAGRWSVLIGVLAGWLGWSTRHSVFGFRLLLVGVVLVVVPVCLWVRRFRGSSQRSAARMHRRSRRNDGLASRWGVWRSSGRWAMRRRMKVLKPSTRQLWFWQRWGVPTTEIATPIARVGRQKVWSPCENVTLRVGGTRKGKSGELMGRILDAPGAVICASTRKDLYDTTAPVRRRRGPVWVFNPSSVAGLESTIVFDPLTGCEDTETAADRAEDMIAGSESPGDGVSGDHASWLTQGRRVLAGLMHAAALGGASMVDVLRWVSDPVKHREEVQRYLRMSTQEPVRHDVAQFIETNDRTRSSITSTIMPALGWLTSPTAAMAGGQRSKPGPELVDGEVRVVGRASFDVAELLRTNGTVYMLGAESSQVAPLMCALTGHIARTARQMASEMPGGRLDPPLTIAPDEVAIICPIPLDKWSSDMGGFNITLHISVQSRAQLRARWGDHGAATILTNASTLLVFGGTKDEDDLALYSTLAGERHERVETRDKMGRLLSYTPQRVPVLPPAQIAQLPAGQVVIFHSGMAPALGKAEMAWKRRDVRAAHREDARIARQIERAPIRAARRAAWAARWAHARQAADRAMTATAAWVDRIGETQRSDDTAGGEGDA